MPPLLVRVVRPILAAIVGVVLVYLILPAFVIVPLSFSSQEYLTFPPVGISPMWYQRVAANPAWRDATMSSMLIGVPTAGLSTILGTLAALAVVRGDLKRATLISAVLVAPMMLPHIILAIGLYPVMLEVGLLRSYCAAIIAHTVVGMPLVFITVSASLRSYSGALELAAMTLGANLWQTFWRVTFPIIFPGVVVGAILAFASSFDELILSLFLTGATTRTLPRLMWEQMSDFLTPVIAAAASCIMMFSIVMLAIAALLQKRASGTASGGAHG